MSTIASQKSEVALLKNLRARSIRPWIIGQGSPLKRSSNLEGTKSEQGSWTIWGQPCESELQVQSGCGWAAGRTYSPGRAVQTAWERQLWPPCPVTHRNARTTLGRLDILREKRTDLPVIRVSLTDQQLQVGRRSARWREGTVCYLQIRVQNLQRICLCKV